MTRIRVVIARADANTFEVNVSCPEKNWAAKSRRLARRENRYPLPDAGESADWVGKIHEKTCVEAGDDRRQELHKSVLVDPAPEDIEEFGRYLFAVLFGPAWNELRKAIPAEPLEIEILTGADTAFLESLPWELMWNDGGPLIAQDKNSISRTIELQKGAPTAKLEVPPRVLFVVGELDDELRPGAEYVEILHNLGRQGANGTRIPGAALRVRSIVDADATQIAAAVEQFSPDIVHVVAHGLVDDKGRAVIRLVRREEGKPDVPDLCSAERLLELLTPKAKAPPAVVLVNACHTAAEVDLGEARAFAAQLVRGGVPAAIGMAGEVASSACRLFARSFYRTLAEQEPAKAGVDAPCPIRQAVANGQLAARRYSTDSKDNAEWARPSLFLAAGATFPVQGDDAREALIRALANLGGSSRLMLGRTVAMRQYEEFIGFRGDGAKRVLAFAQSFRRENLKEIEALPYTFKLGKTTLLAQLQARALLDGYVPCLVESSLEGPKQPPPNLLYLSMRLAEIMDDMRDVFGIPRRVTSHAQRFVFAVKARQEKYEGAESYAFETALGIVKRELAGSGIGSENVDPQSVARVIRSDIEQLMTDVRTKCACMKGALIMLDDVHRYHDYYAHIFDFLNQHGLGTEKAPAPLVITFEDFTEEGKRIADTLVKLHGIGNFAQRAYIVPFPDEPEGRLAYSQYLLSRRLCARRGRSLQGKFDDLLRDMHGSALGVPSFLASVLPLVKYVQDRVDPSPLTKADDEAVFLAVRNEQ